MLENIVQAQMNQKSYLSSAVWLVEGEAP